MSIDDDLFFRADIILSNRKILTTVRRKNGKQVEERAIEIMEKNFGCDPEGIKIMWKNDLINDIRNDEVRR